MAHSEIRTTMRYLHTRNRRVDAELLGAAFAVDALAQVKRTELSMSESAG